MNSLNVTLVQSDLRWENPSANHRQLATLLGALDGRDTDLIVLPEMFATGFTMNSQAHAQPMHCSSSLAWLQDQADARGCVITGSVAIQEGGVCFNRLIWASPEAPPVVYDKRHLFRMAGEHERYGMGEQRLVVECRGVRILLSVCYDLRFPVWMRQQPQDGSAFEYDAMLCVANWPEVRRHPWRTLLQARAIENLSYVIGVNRVGEDAKGLTYSGDSMLVDFKGEPLIDRTPSQPFVATGTLDIPSLTQFRERFPAWQDADSFTLNQ